ncbi:GcvT family protein [Dermacoccaceae bacterium W4C1]
MSSPTPLTSAPARSGRTVIVGAGVVGSALADELSRRGRQNILVLDQGPLFATGGSSSHAPGLVFRTNSSRTMANFASYTVEKFLSLEHPDGWCFNQLGGLEVAITEERLVDLHRRAGWAAAYGIEATVVDAERCAQLHPMIDPAAVLGGLYTPHDGLAKALRAVEAQAGLAQDRGVRFVGNTTVTGIRTAGGRVRGVEVGDEVIDADEVIMCAGFWGSELGARVGFTVPLVPMAHQYAYTDELASLRGVNTAVAEASKPILRHQDRDLYYREHGDVLGIGSYAHRPMPVDMARLADDATDMPSSQAFTPEDFAPSWTDSQELIPELREAKLARGFNGIFSFTPDGGPMLGEHRDIAGLWVGEAVWVTHSAGVARTLAEWIVTGTPDVDISGCDLHRFDTHAQSPAFVSTTSDTAFVEVYDVIHPHQFRTELRGLRTSPFHDRQTALGAEFYEGNGWERPAWFASNQGLLDELVADGLRIPERDAWTSAFFSPISIAEAAWTRQAAGLFDMTPLMRLEVAGPGAADFLTRISTGKVDRVVGSVTYSLMLDERGGVLSDLTCTRVSEEVFQVGANGPLDADRLRRRMPTDGSVTVRDVTGGTCGLGLWGPAARDILQPLCEADLSHEGLGVFRAVSTWIGAVPVLIQRVSYVGELGWEIYTSAEYGRGLWDQLMQAGEPHRLIPGGRLALQSLRIEKGYRMTGADVSADHGPIASGLGFALRKAGGYLGEDAIDHQPQERLRSIVLDDPAHTVLGHEPLLVDGRPVGYVTSAAHSATLGHTIALGWLPAEVDEGHPVEIDYHGTRYAATVHAEPVVDPEGKLIRR